MVEVLCWLSSIHVRSVSMTISIADDILLVVVSFSRHVTFSEASDKDFCEERVVEK